MKEYDKCHKCDGQGICLGSQEVGYTMNGNDMTQHDYECEECRATWDVTFESTPTTRNDHG